MLIVANSFDRPYSRKLRGMTSGRCCPRWLLLWEWNNRIKEKKKQKTEEKKRIKLQPI
jgi:hypothetical protein